MADGYLVSLLFNKNRPSSTEVPGAPSSKFFNKRRSSTSSKRGPGPPESPGPPGKEEEESPAPESKLTHYLSDAPFQRPRLWSPEEDVIRCRSTEHNNNNSHSFSLQSFAKLRATLRFRGGVQRLDDNGSEEYQQEEESDVLLEEDEIIRSPSFDNNNIIKSDHSNSSEGEYKSNGKKTSSKLIVAAAVAAAATLPAAKLYRRIRGNTKNKKTRAQSESTNNNNTTTTGGTVVRRIVRRPGGSSSSSTSRLNQPTAVVGRPATTVVVSSLHHRRKKGGSTTSLARVFAATQGGGAGNRSKTRMPGLTDVIPCMGNSLHVRRRADTARGGATSGQATAAAAASSSGPATSTAVVVAPTTTTVIRNKTPCSYVMPDPEKWTFLEIAKLVPQQQQQQSESDYYRGSSPAAIVRGLPPSSTPRKANELYFGEFAALIDHRKSLVGLEQYLRVSKSIRRLSRTFRKFLNENPQLVAPVLEEDEEHINNTHNNNNNSPFPSPILNNKCMDEDSNNSNAPCLAACWNEVVSFVAGVRKLRSLCRQHRQRHHLRCLRAVANDTGSTKTTSVAAVAAVPGGSSSAAAAAPPAAAAAEGPPGSSDDNNQKPPDIGVQRPSGQPNLSHEGSCRKKGPSTVEDGKEESLFTAGWIVVIAFLLEDRLHRVARAAGDPSLIQEFCACRVFQVSERQHSSEQHSTSEHHSSYSNDRASDRFRSSASLLSTTPARHTTTTATIQHHPITPPLSTKITLSANRYQKKETQSVPKDHRHRLNLELLDELEGHSNINQEGQARWGPQLDTVRRLLVLCFCAWSWIEDESITSGHICTVLQHVWWCTDIQINAGFSSDLAQRRFRNAAPPGPLLFGKVHRIREAVAATSGGRLFSQYFRQEPKTPQIDYYAEYFALPTNCTAGDLEAQIFCLMRAMDYKPAIDAQNVDTVYQAIKEIIKSDSCCHLF